MRILTTFLTVLISLVLVNFVFDDQSLLLRIIAVVVIALIVSLLLNRVLPSGPSRSPERGH